MVTDVCVGGWISIIIWGLKISKVSDENLLAVELIE